MDDNIFKIEDIVSIDQNNISYNEKNYTWFDKSYFDQKGIIKKITTNTFTKGWQYEVRWEQVLWNGMPAEWWYPEKSLKHFFHLEEIEIPTIFDLLKTKR